jgi:cytochrome P450
MTDVRPQWKNPEWYREMRDHHPVWQNPKTQTWHIFRYADVSAALADHQTFSSDFSALYPDQKAFTDGNILAMDPPRHHRLRSLASRAFTPKAISRLDGRIADLTTELLDHVKGKDSWELVDTLAYPLPVIVIAELLGVPASDRPQFKVWADALLASDTNTDPKDAAAIGKTMAELAKFHDYLGEHVTRRRTEPRDDLLTALVRAEIDGERLEDGEIVGFATILLLAGHITTTALLGNSLLCLDERPEVADQLRADPGKLPSAVEEVLRYRAPFAQTTRVTTKEVELSGQVVPANAVLNVCMAAANRDERQFERPDEFVIDRSPNPHLGFGRGIHFCIGAPLARLEAKVALGILLRRYEKIRVDPAQPLELQEDSGFDGVKSLHLLVE